MFVCARVACMKVQMENKISQLESKLSLSETKLHEERAVTQALKQELHRVLQQHETVRNKDANPPTYQIMRIVSAPSLPGGSIKPPGRPADVTECKQPPGRLKQPPGRLYSIYI